MSTITLPNIRVGSDLQVRARLKDGGVAIDWSTLSNIKACIYSDAQRALAGRCAFSIDEEDNTLLVCTYAANKPQYLGVNRIVISAKYMGETKTYDKPAFSFVRWTADQEGEEITIDDPDVDVEIDVEDISSSILQEAVDAAFTAADRANDAAAAAEHMVDIHTGPEGKSAYEVAVDEGFVGTEEEWLASLVGPQGAQGIQGETGEAAGFGSVSAALQEDGGDPSVVVAASGEDTSKNFAFTFKNLKGDKGDKGDQGNTGSSVDYPYELVNNLTTNDATKGLTAAMGVQLEGEVSQLEAKIDGMPGYDAELELAISQGVNIGVATKHDLVDKLEAGKTYHIKFTGTEVSTISLSFYDAEGNNVKCSWAGGTPANSNSFDNGKELDFVPQADAYKWANYLTAAQATGTGTVVWEITGAAIPGIASKVSALESTVASLTPDVAALKKVQDKLFTTENIDYNQWIAELFLVENLPAYQYKLRYHGGSEALGLQVRWYTEVGTENGTANIPISSVVNNTIIEIRCTEKLSGDISVGDLLGYIIINDATSLKAATERPWETINTYRAKDAAYCPTITTYLNDGKVPVNSVGTGQIVDGAVTASKLASNSVGKANMKEGSVGLDNLAFLESWNLINPDDPDYLTDKEFRSDGTIGNTSTGVHKFLTGYIKVNPGDKLFYSTSESVPARWPNYRCYYNEQKEFLSVVESNVPESLNPITIPSGVSYLRVNCSKINGVPATFKWQIAKSEVSTQIQDYNPMIPTSVILPEALNQSVDKLIDEREKVGVYVPSKIYAVVGDTLQLFYKSIFRCRNPYDYIIEVNVTCSVVSGGYPVMKQYPRYFEVTPTAEMAGNEYPITFSIYDHNHILLGQRSSTIAVASAGTSPASQKNILIVGDSTPRNGVMPDELQRRLVGSGGTPAGSAFTNVALVGRQTGTNPGSTAKCECEGGSFASYIAEADSNPFYHNGAIDMDWYVDTYCNGQVDIIFTTLFANGAASFARNVPTLIANMESFITQCRNSSRLANVKFGIGLEFNYDERGGLGNVYGNPGYSDWSNWDGMAFTHYAILDALEKWIEDNNAGDYVFVLNLLNEFDCENGYMQKMKKLNVRMPDNPVTNVVEVTTEPFGSNGVHPHEYGRKMFSDTCWRLFVSKFCQS